MRKFLKDKGIKIVVVCLILFPLLFLSSQAQPKTKDIWYNKIIYYLTQPMIKLVTGSLSSIGDFYSNYIYLIHTKKLNEHLKEEVADLTQQIRQLKEIEFENERLRSLLDFRKQAPPSLSPPAQVISRDTSNEFETIQINIGSNAQVQENMAVVTPVGIVGRITAVLENSSTVLTLVDPASRIDAIVQRSRARGIVVGSFGNTCLMKHVSRTDDVQIDDEIISSGMGGIYPKGFYIGKVKKVVKKPYGILQHVEIEPGVDFSKLEEVFVARNVNTSEAVKTEAPTKKLP
ncbi:MAG: rod shape-determining protein MreC [Deltaproteobacteria bacterium]|nr:rod shape-determining protein MreC [Deltaproteobacteria bacterium]